MLSIVRPDPNFVRENDKTPTDLNQSQANFKPEQICICKVSI